MAEPVKFEIGGTYENMKGTYEVVSIKNDTMVIRWQDGLQIETSIELQQRIIERMAFDKAEEGRAAAPKKSVASKKKKSAPSS